MEIASAERRELKYYINYIDYLNLKSKLSNVFTKDKNSNLEGLYCVRSLYFDNKSNDNYYEKIASLDKRKKYRIRIYNINADPVKLEIKSKFNNIILKNSIVINSQDIKKIMSGDYECLLAYNNPTANKIYYEFTKDFYKPVIIIDYKRDAYHLDLNNIRITFDSDLKKDEVNLNSLFSNDLKMSPVLNNNKVIMEIKYDLTMPVWVRNVLQLSRFERCAISKYSLSRYLEN